MGQPDEELPYVTNSRLVLDSGIGPQMMIRRGNEHRSKGAPDGFQAKLEDMPRAKDRNDGLMQLDRWWTLRKHHLGKREEVYVTDPQL
jgi:hypothetical protein